LLHFSKRGANVFWELLKESDLICSSRRKIRSKIHWNPVFYNGLNIPIQDLSPTYHLKVYDYKFLRKNNCFGSVPISFNGIEKGTKTMSVETNEIRVKLGLDWV
jgi:Ca2+-dependent lipid-binding protein